MNDQQLLDQFERGTLSAQSMSHVNHLRLAWLFLKALPLPEALIQFRNGLKQFTALQGVPEKYNETITFALMMIIGQRMEPETNHFTSFLSQNRDLEQNWMAVLESYYPKAVLFAEPARSRFVMPTGNCSCSNQTSRANMSKSEC